MRTLAIVIASLLAACGAPASPASVPTAPQILDARTGQSLGMPALLERLREARVVYVGERHDNADDHRMQAAIADALLDGEGPYALGFEMFGRPMQPALEEMDAGALEEAEFLERVEWDSRWGFDYAFYRPLVAHGRRPGVRTVALNTPREVTRAIARGGLENLEPAQREALAELDESDETHRAMIAEALSGHPHMSEDLFERFYLAQLAWDETMAETVALAIAADPPVERMLVFAGGMHTRRSAIPSRVQRRAPHAGLIVLPVEPEEVEALRAQRPPPADFLVVSASED